jgi:hypothetical protein
MEYVPIQIVSTCKMFSLPPPLVASQEPPLTVGNIQLAV